MRVVEKKGLYWNSKHIRNVYCSNASMWKPVGHYNIQYCALGGMLDEKDRKKPSWCAFPDPRATMCALSFVKQLCKKNRLTLFFLYFFYPILHRRHRRYSLADKTKSKRLYRLGKNKSFIRTLVGTLSRCPVVAKEHFGAFRVIILCQRNPFTFYCLNHSRLLCYF